MTAQEFLLSKFEGDEDALDQFLHDFSMKFELTPIVSAWLSEFALLKCAEQREICANIPFLEYEDDRIKMLNAENPEM